LTNLSSYYGSGSIGKLTTRELPEESLMMQMLPLVVALSVISQKALGIMLAAALRGYKLKFDSRPENQLNIKK